jgi:hypothetical protein
MSKCGHGKISVLQMTPCYEGWKAVFNMEDAGKPQMHVTPIASWLLVEHDDETHVHPLVSLGGEMVDAADVDNYIGTVAPEESALQLWERAKAERDIDQRKTA